MFCFFPDTHSGTPGAAFRQPVISGFELAQPQFEPSWSSPSWSNPAHNLYKHPRVQADSGRRAEDSEQGSESYRKKHDIYALGVIRVEIACWQPVHAILRVDLEQASLRDTMPVKRRLLESHVLQKVRFYMGDTVCDVIKACLSGWISQSRDSAKSTLRETCPFKSVSIRKLSKS